MFGDSSFQRMNKKKSFFLWISKCAIIYNLLDIFAHYVLSTTLKLYICKVQTTVFSLLALLIDLTGLYFLLDSIEMHFCNLLCVVISNLLFNSVCQQSFDTRNDAIVPANWIFMSSIDMTR